MHSHSSTYFDPLVTNFLDFPEEIMLSTQSDVLPEQLFAPVTRDTGTRALMTAILEDALEVYCRQGFSRRIRRLRRESEEWIASRNQDFTFSFENICAYLYLDADAVREALPALRERVKNGGKIIVRQGMVGCKKK